MPMCPARHPENDHYCSRVYGHEGNHRYVVRTVFEYEEWSDAQPS